MHSPRRRASTFRRRMSSCVSRDRVIVFNLGDQLGIAEAYHVAFGRTVDFRIGLPADQHHVEFSGVTFRQSRLVSIRDILSCEPPREPGSGHRARRAGLRQGPPAPRRRSAIPPRATRSTSPLKHRVQSGRLPPKASRFSSRRQRRGKSRAGLASKKCACERTWISRSPMFSTFWIEQRCRPPFSSISLSGVIISPGTGGGTLLAPGPIGAKTTIRISLSLPRNCLRRKRSIIAPTPGSTSSSLEAGRPYPQCRRRACCGGQPEASRRQSRQRPRDNSSECRASDSTGRTRLR